MPVDTEAATESVEAEPVVAVTDDALGRILEIRDAEDDADDMVLRISITGVNGPEYAYDLSFEEAEELDDSDVRYQIGSLALAIPAADTDLLTGAVLDLPSRPGQGGLVIRNPNRPNPMSGREIELTGDLAEKVNQLLDQSINPSLASHGGFATLVGVEDTKVMLTMGGSCHGCALSTATMRQGIETAIFEAIPEVTEVIDMTDHATGANPYYT